MRTRSALALSLAGVVAAAGLAPALAAPAKSKPKPIARSWTAEAFPPDPSHVTGLTGGICGTTLPQAQYNEPFTVPYAGVLKVDMKNFRGDWDLAIWQGDRVLADSAQATEEPIDRPEKITLKFRRGGAKIQIRSCNFAGGPTADVAMTYTAT